VLERAKVALHELHAWATCHDARTSASRNTVQVSKNLRPKITKHL